MPAHKVEENLWDVLLRAGNQGMQALFGSHGSGDLGPSLTLPNGDEVNRVLTAPHASRNSSVEGGQRELRNLVWKWCVRPVRRGKDILQLVSTLDNYAAHVDRRSRRVAGHNKSKDMDNGWVRDSAPTLSERLAWVCASQRQAMPWPVSLAASLGTIVGDLMNIRHALVSLVQTQLTQIPTGTSQLSLRGSGFSR